MAQPFPVVITDGTGKALTISGASQGAFTAQPFPVVICDANGNVQTLGAGTALPATQGGTGSTQAGQYGVMIARSGSPIQGTATTAEQILATITVPAGLLTSTGQIKFEGALVTGVVAGTYTLNVRIGGIGGTQVINLTSIGGSSFQRFFGTTAARGATNSQITWAWAKIGSANQNLPDTASAKDFTASVDIVITITLTTAADNTLVTLEGYNLVVYP